MFGIKTVREKELEAEVAFLQNEVRYLRNGFKEWEEYAGDLHNFFDRKLADKQLIINDLTRQVMENKKAPSSN